MDLYDGLSHDETAELIFGEPVTVSGPPQDRRLTLRSGDELHPPTQPTWRQRQMSHPDRRATYVNPTVYTGVDNSMRIAREEIFGPVLVVIPFDTEEEAVAITNDSDFGLVGAVWTRDFPRALRVAEAIEVGGQKQSGYGREKGIEALNLYTQLKSVTIALGRP
jgi:acyl-CoA reductase-like NAD-dependent aldehyde dehydrogenase